MNPQYLFMGTADTLLETFWFLADSNNIVFMIIGIIGYFTIPTVAGWIIQAGGMGSYGRNVGQVANRAGGIAGGVAGATVGNMVGRAGKLLK